MKKPEEYRLLSTGTWVLSEDAQRIINKLNKKRKHIKALKRGQKKK